MISFKIKGGKEIAALLAQLPVQVETKILRNGLAAGARIIRDEARARAPRKSGALAKAIQTSRDTRRREGRVIAKVRVKRGKGAPKHAYLALFFEYGVAPHLIARTGSGEGRVAVRKAKAGRGSVKLRPMTIGSEFVSGIISHPGLAPQPFMRPALDSKAAAAVQAVGDYLTRYLQWGSISAPPVSVDEEE